jgi:hypothetical protein
MSGMPDVNAIMAKSRLNAEMMQEPDLPAWHDQREKMALAVGDRTIDKSFDRIFDSMIIALANLGCRVNNMERISGYLTSSLPQLPPAQHDALAKEGLAEYAQAKGYPPSVLDTSGPYGNMGGGYSMMMERMGAGLTLTMAKQVPIEPRSSCGLTTSTIRAPSRSFTSGSGTRSTNRSSWTSPSTDRGGPASARGERLAC